MKIILKFYNTKPDEQMIIDLRSGIFHHRLTIPAYWIDKLAEGLAKHCGSEGDGEGFSLELD